MEEGPRKYCKQKRRPILIFKSNTVELVSPKVKPEKWIKTNKQIEPMCLYVEDNFLTKSVISPMRNKVQFMNLNKKIAEKMVSEEINLLDEDNLRLMINKMGEDRKLWTHRTEWESTKKTINMINNKQWKETAKCINNLTRKEKQKIYNVPSYISLQKMEKLTKADDMGYISILQGNPIILEVDLLIRQNFELPMKENQDNDLFKNGGGTFEQEFRFKLD